MSTLSEQIEWCEREIRFMESEQSEMYEDDLPILRGILESLYRLLNLEK